MEKSIEVEQCEQAIEALSEEIVKLRNRNKALVETIADLQNDYQDVLNKLYLPKGLNRGLAVKAHLSGATSGQNAWVDSLADGLNAVSRGQADADREAAKYFR